MTHIYSLFILPEGFNLVKLTVTPEPFLETLVMSREYTLLGKVSNFQIFYFNSQNVLTLSIWTFLSYLFQGQGTLRQTIRQNPLADVFGIYITSPFHFRLRKSHTSQYSTQ